MLFFIVLSISLFALDTHMYFALLTITDAFVGIPFVLAIAVATCIFIWLSNWLHVVVFVADWRLRDKFIGKICATCVVSIVGRPVTTEVRAVGATYMTSFTDEITSLIEKFSESIFKIFYFASIHAYLAFIFVRIFSHFSRHIRVTFSTFLYRKRVTRLRPLGWPLAILSFTLSRDSISWKLAPMMVTWIFILELKIAVVGVRLILSYSNKGWKSFLLTFRMYT